MSKTIFILGAGIMQIPAFKLAKEQGWTTIAADGNPQAPAIPYCDHFWHIDLKDRVGLAERAKTWMENNPLDGVFTCGTDFSASVAWVAEKLGLPGIPYQRALDATDKIRMRQCLKEAGLKVPPFWELGPQERWEDVISNPQFPLVVKPADSMGARGVKRVDDSPQLSKAIGAAQKLSRTGRALVEQFLHGPEFSLDGLIYKGKFQLCGIADRDICFPPYFIEMGHSFPSQYSKGQQQSVIDEFLKGIKALNIDMGAAKGDIKLTPQGPVIGEIAARLSGGFMSGWTYPYSSGKQPILGGMRIALAMEPGDQSCSSPKPCVERAMISIPGRIHSIERLEQSHEMEGVKDLFINKDEGDWVDFPVNNVEKAGNIIATGHTFKEAEENARRAAGNVIIRLEAKGEKTPAFLSAEDIWQGNAFGVIPREFPWKGEVDFNSIPPEAFNREIYGFKELDTNQKDWMGRVLGEELKLLEEEYCLSFISKKWDKGDAYFWTALFRGGSQAVRWLFDSQMA